METLEIVREAYNAACAELEKYQERNSKLESLLHDILEAMPAEFICDTIDAKTLDNIAVDRLRKYIALAISAKWELASRLAS